MATHELTNEQYHAHPAISRSALSYIARSPRHYWARYVDPEAKPEAPTPAMQFGTAVHTAVLEPELFVENYDVGPSASKLTKAWKEAAAACEAEGKSLVTQEEFDLIEGIRHSLWLHPSARRALESPGSNEATYIAKCPVSKLQLKARADRITDSGWVVDLKTTQDASAPEFARSVAKFGYHLQAAFYLHVIEAATGKRPKGFLFVAVEKARPFAVQVFRASSLMLEQGTKEMFQHLDTLAHCLKEDQWPSYSDGLVDLDLPAWARR